MPHGPPLGEALQPSAASGGFLLDRFLPRDAQQFVEHALARADLPIPPPGADDRLEPLVPVGVDRTELLRAGGEAL